MLASHDDPNGEGTPAASVVASLLTELNLTLPELYERVGLDIALISAPPEERERALRNPAIWLRFARLARVHAEESERRGLALRGVADAFQETAILELGESASLQWITVASRPADPTHN